MNFNLIVPCLPFWVTFVSTPPLKGFLLGLVGWLAGWWIIHFGHFLNSKQEQFALLVLLLRATNGRRRVNAGPGALQWLIKLHF